ncbi:lytic murein transglycosylase [Acinetobacter portensis]|uniref:Lytic murein transglycosylase n=2 Tax=Acinetobacter TaxID=469 RepID=A0A6L6GF51_9GAMM|nr:MULTISPECIES: lytic murein transglycosylase [Acinetobacter]MCK7610109.1 lytic murein transglycosylase [Acinetobacter portensis]MCK7640881.1 lytic murein transglycosylase [Acinetobacter portensis]MDY6460310.1 lytic murein transglycosylase [Acinetobacter faecalis]MDY6462773.1 lytic murein transglycosylase [Acinetobacter faecalis]MDY6485361.1 lytic murein transglycosylase [Acinetobacter faecalis]
MRNIAFLFGSALFITTQVQAELIINGQTVPVITAGQNISDSNSPSPFQICISNLKNQAMQSGVSSLTFDRYTQNLTPDYSVIEKLNYQPEFSTPIWDYLSGLVDVERVELGKIKIRQHADVLKKVSTTYGVSIETVVAVWGVESNYGNISGKNDLLQSLGTLSCEGRRQNFFRGEFFAAMRILQRGDLTQDQLKGSWAGAFGHTQFMPSTYEELAVDFDGDGRRDLVSSTTDALASTANFLKKRGWQTGQPWGFEIKVPEGMSIAGEGRRNKKTLASWVERGVVRVDGTPLIQGNLTELSQAGLMSPAGASGPLFLVFKNFDAIYSYNAAESYALAIAHLSDRLQGAEGFVAEWPTNDAGTSRTERRQIQAYLLSRGYSIGDVDGLIGDRTRQAIRQEQLRFGLSPTGRAGQLFLNAIRDENAKKIMK